MTTSALRRAGLLLAAAVCLCLPAAAQTDAGLISALDEASVGLAKLVPIKNVTRKPPVSQAPRAPDAVWRRILEAVKNEGTYKPAAPPRPDSFTLEDVAGDPNAEHTMYSIAFAGQLNKDGKFEALVALLVVKKFKMDPKDGNWHVDLWAFQSDVYGEAETANHETTIATTAGESVSTTPHKLSPSDPDIKVRYDEMLKHWAERKPSGA